MIESGDTVSRLLLTFGLAFAVGLERQLRRKPVGFGTFIFVATGAAALTILAIDLEGQNPLPVIGGVITGVGFLGAGALIRSNDRVFGFTTAALVWAMAALGVAAGAGLFLLVAVDYAVVWAVIATDRVLEARGFGSHAKVVHITLANPVAPMEIDSLLPRGTTHFERYHVDKETHQVRLSAHIRVRPSDVDELLASLQRNDKVRGFEVE
jgi:putative Mg2+ transporter-C (MgtC) family protein